MKNVKSFDEINESMNFDVNLKKIIKDLTSLVETYNISIVASHRGLEIEDNTDRNTKITLPNLVNKKSLDDFMKRMKAMSKPVKVSWNTGKTDYVPTEDDIVGVK